MITKVSIQCPAISKSKHVALLGVDSFPKILQIWRICRNELAEILSAFEFFDKKCVINLEKNLGLDIPEFLKNENFGVLIETSGSNEDHDNEKLIQFLKNTGITSGSIANSESQANYFFHLRESIPEAMMKDGVIYAYDISLPKLENMYDLVSRSEKYILSESNMFQKYDLKNIVGYGHIGDGNLHINISAERFYGNFTQKYEEWLWKSVKDLNGSISAEHGIGSVKTDVIHYSKSKESLELMCKLKRLMDPNGILNPYKVVCNQMTKGIV